MDEFSIILQAKLSEADCIEITHLLNEAYHRGRADAIDELKSFVHTNVKGNIFVFIEDFNVDKLSFVEQLKENKNE